VLGLDIGRSVEQVCDREVGAKTAVVSSLERKQRTQGTLAVVADRFADIETNAVRIRRVPGRASADRSPSSRYIAGRRSDRSVAQN
jgi:hypothetical protein